MKAHNDVTASNIAVLLAESPGSRDGDEDPALSHAEEKLPPSDFRNPSQHPGSPPTTPCAPAPRGGIVVAPRVGSQTGVQPLIVPTPPSPPSPTMCYGNREGGGWRPTTVADFGGGGAFPEVHVAQFPGAGMGWWSKKGVGGTTDPITVPPPASLDCSFESLQTTAARAMLRLSGDGSGTQRRPQVSSSPAASRPQRMTAEYAAFIRFVAGVLDQSTSGDGDRAPCALKSEDVVASLIAAHPNARPVERVSGVDPETVADAYLLSGHFHAGDASRTGARAVGTPVGPQGRLSAVSRVT